jgi:hypothetical protein
MSRRAQLVLVLVLVLVLGFWLVSIRQRTAPEKKQLSPNQPTAPVVLSPSTNPTPIRPDAPLGSKVLLGYASSSFPPEHDLTLMSHLMENSLLLAKSAANRPLSANEDWADFLRGKNAAHERFLPDEHPALNAKGQLIDRWGVPLFFHALGGNRYEIRSAGPDKKLWTADDIHRNSDGTFRHGADLNPPALYSAGNPGH